MPGHEVMESSQTGADQLAGYIDHLGEKLNLRGWAWCETAPERRLEIEVLINGAVVGATLADLHRQDVQDAGKGDGRYGFAWKLPISALAPAQQLEIAARVAGTDFILTNPFIISRQEMAARLVKYATLTQDQEEGQEALRASARLAAEDPWQVMELAKAARESGTPREAAALLQGLLEAHPKFWHAHVLLGHIARAAGDRAAALSWFTQAAALEPGDVWRWLDMAEEQRALTRYEDAEAALVRAASVAPEFWAVALSQGYNARAQGEHAQARQYFETAARLAPEELAPRIGLLEELRDSGALEAARQQALALLQAHPGNMPLLLSLAYTERQAGLHEEAAARFAEALALEPENPTLLAELARQEFRLGRQQQSNAHLTRALALDPGHADAVIQLASQAQIVGDIAQAHQIYRAAAERRPAEPAFRYGMLDALAWQGKIQDALAGLWAMEQEHGTTPQLQSWRITLLRRSGLMEEALQAARAATAAAPHQFWLWVERFQTELLAGPDAMLQKCLFNIPASTRAERAIRRRCIGALAESLWQMDSALAHYAAAAALNPNDIMLQEALARLKLMRFDLEGARTHLRRQYELMAAERRLRGESLNVSQSLLGQMIDEYALDEALYLPLAELNSRPIPERLEPIAALVREAPDSTAPAASLLLALRQAEKLEFIPAPEGSSAIPRIITTFWNTPELPPDIEALLQSWRARNPGYEFRRFDEAQARDYIAAKFPNPVLEAYQRVREIPQKADIFRLAMLVAEGGVYVDADDRCLRPLDTLLPPRANLVLAQEEFGCAANHFIAAAPGHPVLQAALRAVVIAVKRGDNEIPWLLSGPGLLTRALAGHLAAPGIAAGIAPGLALLEKRALGQAVASNCFAAYKTYHMRHRKRIDAAAQQKGA